MRTFKSAIAISLLALAPGVFLAPAYGADSRHESRRDDRHDRDGRRDHDRGRHDDRRDDHRADRRDNRHDRHWDRRDHRHDYRHDRRDDHRYVERRDYRAPVYHGPVYRGPVYYGRYHAGSYYRPYGYRTYSWHRGDRLPVAYYAPRYVIRDYHSYRLGAPPRGYHWVRVDNDVVLAAVTTGIVLSVVNGLFY